MRIPNTMAAGHEPTPKPNVPMNEGNGPQGISWPFFAVGVFSLLVAAGLAIAGFAIATLTRDQRGILIFWFSLAAGFAAGSFVGGITVKSGGSWVAGLMVTATGGFAVWVLFFFFAAQKLFPEPPGREGQYGVPYKPERINDSEE